MKGFGLLILDIRFLIYRMAVASKNEAKQKPQAKGQKDLRPKT